jgi:hypothetical protein
MTAKAKVTRGLGRLADNRLGKNILEAEAAKEAGDGWGDDLKPASRG